MTANRTNAKTTSAASKKNPALPAATASDAPTVTSPPEATAAAAAPATKRKKTVAAKTEKPVKHAKPHKQKMVRDSFTMPEDDYSKLGMLKAKCLESGLEVKKSELLRAGLIALTALPASKLLKAVKEVEKLKTGRPKKG